MVHTVYLLLKLLCSDNAVPEKDFQSIAVWIFNPGQHHSDITGNDYKKLSL